MDNFDALTKLRDAPSGSRHLDGVVARCAGWRMVADTGPGPRRDVWYPPSSSEPGRVPRFTTDVQDAYALANLIAPNHVGACRWTPNGGMAQIGDDGSPVYAATIELAICIAAIEKLP